MGSKLESAEVDLAFGIIFGLASNRIFNLGPSWGANLLTFFAGAVPAIVVLHYSLGDASDNGDLIARGVDYAFNDKWTFAATTVVFTGVLAYTYYLIFAIETDAFLDFIPGFQSGYMGTFFVGLAALGTFIFGAIAGWNIELLYWILEGADPKKIPAKPGGRTDFGYKKFPSDVVEFVLGFPLSVIDVTIHCVNKGSATPWFFFPLKYSVDQYNRFGNLVVDLTIMWEEAIDFEKKAAWTFFDDLAKLLDPFESKAAKVGDDGNPYPQVAAASGEVWLAYPALWKEGDS
jgi:hypothetical protein